MKLYIKQRFLSFTDSFDIYDETGKSKYYVETEFLSLGHKMHVYNCNNQEIGGIYQRVLTFLPKFDIEIHGNYVGMIKKEFTLFFPSYHIDCNGWRVEGNIFGWDYDVIDRNGNKAAHISKELFHLTDHYVIDIFNSGDEIFALMIVLAIDAVNCSNN